MLDIIHTPLTVLHVLACVFLILVVLLQPGKGGGLGTAFGGAGAQQVFGGRGAGNVLTKATWITAAIFFCSSMTLAYISTSVGDTLAEKKQGEDTGDKIKPAEKKKKAGEEQPPGSPEGPK